MEFKLRTQFLGSELFKVIPNLIRISFIISEQYINKSTLLMKLLIYWLYVAIISGIWFFWRYRIYENEFYIIDDALKDCVSWGKRHGYLLPEKPSYFQFFLVERPWNILILNFTFLPFFLINLLVILLLISPWERKVMRYKRAMHNLKNKWEMEYFKGTKS